MDTSRARDRLRERTDENLNLWLGSSGSLSGGTLRLPNWVSKEFLVAVIISLAVIVLGLSITGPPYQNQQPPGNNGGHHSQNDQRESNVGNGPAPLQIECDPNCAAKHPEEHGNQSRLARLVNKTIDDPVALFTFFLGVATFLLVIVVLGQVKDARESAERQLRAYVVTQVKDIVWPPSRNGSVIVHVEIKNTGQTPAYDVQVISRSNVMEYPFADDYDFTLGSGEDPSMGLLGPQQPTETDSISNPLTPTDWRDMTSVTSGRRLCTYGTVTYRDAFKITRTTNFCVSHVVEEFQEPDGRVRLASSSRTYRRHNDAD